MERLTEINGNNEVYCIVYGKKIVVDNIDMLKICQRLNLYEDLEEQGLLLRLPCGIGSDVYFIPSETNFKLNILNDKPQFNRVYHQNVARITFIRNGWYMECDKDLEYATGNILVDKMYKETWFLAKAEAEQKLKEMESD